MSTPVRAGNLYLNLIWHQHQPLYLDPQTDQLRGPWVRTHATKDYYDMAAMHADFPEVHATINLTSSLLYQLDEYYVKRLGPFLYKHADGHWAIDTTRFFAQWKGKTDPWIDLALKPTTQFTAADRAKLLTEPWNAFGISTVQIARFPQYNALRHKSRDSLTVENMTAVKAWFYLAHFDPDFLRGTAKIDINLSDLIHEQSGRFYLKHPLTERDANRLVADAVRVMQAVIPAHRALSFVNDRRTPEGIAYYQLEIITTPFYHPILPLLIDTDVAKTCQPRDSLPPRFAYPQDAHAQVLKGREYYMDQFHANPYGMWPAEGSVSDAAARIFRNNGIRWICGDMHVLQRSSPSGLDVAQPYRISCDSLNSEGSDPVTEKYESCIAIVFRETTLSDHIGFTYQKMQPVEAAEHFVNEVMRYKPKDGEPDRLLTVILDGENAWEWYENDMDAKVFLRTLYEKFTRARTDQKFTCVTPTEYFAGNPTRKIPAHPIGALTKIESLWPGSWIGASFDTWIGEPEENEAWEYLLQTRRDLEQSGLGQGGWTITPLDTANMRRTNAGMAAYESMYAAEGSDWFWWYGADQSAPAGDRPFEEAFFAHLRAVYKHMRDAGVNIKTPDFAPILSAAKVSLQETGGTMSRSDVHDSVTVRFVCDASGQNVSKAIFITGNIPQLGNWSPNTLRLHNDGLHHDSLLNDGVWTLEITVPLGSEIQYKYTNSGAPGIWVPSEEFPQANRSFTADGPPESIIVRHDIFGKRD